MKKIILIVCTFFITNTALAHKSAYTIYNAKGLEVSYSKMIRSLAQQDVILFGELHNNPIAHWLQLEVTKDLHKERSLILGAEMIETDNQDELDSFLVDSISFKDFKANARLWPNYKTDYAPLVDFAKAKQLPFVASNIPRRYARMVHKNDFESLNSLSEEEKSWIAPLPIHFDIMLPTYQSILKMMGEHGSPNLVKAQAIKDATMAHFILKYFIPEHLFIHYNGAFHSDFYEGILYYLKRQRGDLSYKTISTVSQADIDYLNEEHYEKADFIIVVDEDMTTTY